MGFGPADYVPRRTRTQLQRRNVEGLTFKLGLNHLMRKQGSFRFRTELIHIQFSRLINGIVGSPGSPYRLLRVLGRNVPNDKCCTCHSIVIKLRQILDFLHNASHARLVNSANFNKFTGNLQRVQTQTISVFRKRLASDPGDANCASLGEGRLRGNWQAC